MLVLHKLVLSHPLSLMLSYYQYLCQSLVFWFYLQCYGVTETNNLKSTGPGPFSPRERQSFNSAFPWCQMRYQAVFYSKQ